MNESPIVSLVVTGNFYVGQEITIDASGSYDPDGTIKETVYKYGDGNGSKGKKPGIVKHIYNTPGIYNVAVSVRDNQNNSSSKTVKIAILKIGEGLIVINQSISVNSPDGNPVIVNYPAPIFPVNGIPPYSGPVYSIPNGSFFPVGVTNVLEQYTDSLGNTGKGTLVVTVVDTTPPPIPPDPNPNPDPNPPPATPSVIISPVPGTVLSGASVLFTWSNTGAQSYQLYIGNTPGASDIFSSPVNSNTSITATGIPTDGRTIYVRLWTLLQWWALNDYTYTANGGSPPIPPQPNPIVITPPANISGTSLDGNPISLAWGSSSAHGGTPPYVFTYKIGFNVVTSPQSFPVGSTVITAIVTDSLGSIDQSQFTATVSFNQAPGPPSTGHPKLGMTVSGASPTVTEEKAKLAGPLLTLFQAWVNIYCKTSAHGGILDIAAATVDSLFLTYTYSYLIRTYPVAGVNYQDVHSITDLEAVFLPAFDIQVAALLNSWTTGLYHSVKYGYDKAYDSLSGTRRQNAVNAMLSIADPGLNIGPFGHSDNRGRGRLTYHASGYAFKGDTPGNETQADLRISKRSTYYFGNNGNASNNSLFGKNGGYPEGMGYWYSEFLQSYGYGEFMYREDYRTISGDASAWNTGVSPHLEFDPLWRAYHLAPYRPTIGGFSYDLMLKTSQSQDLPIDATNGPDWSSWTGAWLKNHARVYANTNPNMAGLAMWDFKRHFDASGNVPQALSVPTYRWSHMANFVGYNTVVDKSPATLNLSLSYFFENYGKVVSISNWLFNGTGYRIEVELSPYQYDGSGYAYFGTGGYDLHYGGPLIVHPGAGAHDSLQQMPWGKCSLQFVKDSDTRNGRTNWSKDGTRIIATDALGLSDFSPGGIYDIGGLKNGTGIVDLNPGKYDAVYADITRNYNTDALKDSENPSCCVNAERYVIIFPPAVSGVDSVFEVVLDRTISKDSTFQQRHAIYPAGHPTPGTKTYSIVGNSSSSTLSRNGISGNYYDGTAGTMYVNIHYTTVNGLSAQGYASPIFPTNCRIVERGGPNGSNQLGQADSHEKEDPMGYQGGSWQIDGVSDSVASSGMWQWEAQYKLEFLSQVNTVNLPILLVNEGSIPGNARTSVGAISGTNTLGVRIGTKFGAIFGINKGILSSGDFKVDTAGTFKFLIMGLNPNLAYTFVKGSNITSITLVSTGDTDLNYNANGSGNMFLSIVVSAPGSGANNLISFS